MDNKTKAPAGPIPKEQPAIASAPVGIGAEIKPVKWVKESHALVKQKFGFKTTHEIQLSLDLWGNEREELAKQGKNITLEAVGIDVTEGQNRCIHALATMLTDRNYKGIGEEKAVAEYKWRGNLDIEFTLAEYLRAYGLQKKAYDIKGENGKATERKEYQRGEVETAITALRELATKDFALYLTEAHYDNKNKALKYDMMRKIDRLFRFVEGWKDLTETEKELIKDYSDTVKTDSKRTLFRIAFNPIWGKGITEKENQNFILTPANWRQEIGILEETKPEIFDTRRGGIGKTNKAQEKPIRFIEYLRLQHKEKAAKKRPMADRTAWKTIAEHLRIANTTITRNPAAAKKIIKKCLILAIELRYLKTGELKGDKVEYSLNEGRFYNTQATPEG